MFFLREKFIKVNDKNIKIREFTFRELLIYQKLKTIEAQLLFILDNQKVEGIKEDDIFAIFKAVSEVNAPIPKEKPSGGKTISLTIEERVDFLCGRWGQSPLQMIDKYSAEMINSWNSICREHENKLYKSSGNTPQDKIEASKYDAVYQELKKKKPIKNLSLKDFQEASKKGVK